MLAPHMYRLVALCDVSPELLGHCGDKFHVPEEHRYGDLYVHSPLPLASPSFPLLDVLLSHCNPETTNVYHAIDNDDSVH
jgi:hypothetical protein